MLEELKRGWKLYLLILVGIAALVAYVQLKQASEAMVGTPTTAVIISFGGGGTAQVFQPGEVMVTVRSDDGVVGTGQVPLTSVEGCKVGDRIAAETKGINVIPLPKPCVTER